jgi:hypothetical protein
MIFATRLAASGLSRSIHAKCVQGLLPLALTNGLPSGLQKAPEPVAHLFMRQKFAPLHSGLAPFHRFDKAVFFFEVARHYILHSLIEVAALLGRSLREPVLQVGVEMNFHALKIREKRLSGKLCSGLYSTTLLKRDCVHLVG